MIVDSHCHILPESFAGRHQELAGRDATFAALFPAAGGRRATAADLAAEMAGAGVGHSVVVGFGWTDLGVAREANDYILGAAADYPQQLTGFCAVNPAWGQAALAEVERCVAARARGIGELHPDTQGFDLADYRMMAPMMELARHWDLPVLVHCSEPVGHQYPGKGQTTPDKVYRFIRNFPENVIICAHWGGGLAFYGLMPEVPGELAKVYFDTAASPFLYRKEVFAVVAQTIGADKILLGSDYPLLRQRRLLSQLESCGLDAGDKAAIGGGNAARLLGLAGSG